METQERVESLAALVWELADAAYESDYLTERLPGGHRRYHLHPGAEGSEVHLRWQRLKDAVQRVRNGGY